MSDGHGDVSVADEPALEPAAPPADAEGDSVARNAAFAFAAQMVTSVATAALTVYLVRKLGPAGYGTFAIAISLSALLILPGDFGISQSAARFVAENRGRWGAIGGVLRAAMQVKFLVATLVSVALIVLAQPIANAYNAPDLAWPLRVVAIALFGQSFMTLFVAAFIAVGRVSLNLRTISAEALMEATASAGLLLLGTGVTGAAAGRAIGYVFGALIGAFLLVRLVGRRNLRHGEAPPGGVRKLAGYASALLVIDGAYALLGSAGVLLIGAFLDPRSVGLFQPAMRLITFLHYPGYAVSSGVAPRLARTEHREPDVGALQVSLRYLVLFQTVLLAPTIVWAHPLSALVLGAGYGKTADVLIAVAPYTFLSGFAPVISLSVNYLGESRRRVPVAIITLVLAVTLNLVLIPSIGIVGTAISTDVAYGFYVFAHFWICRTLVPLRLRPLLADFGRCLVAAAAMAGVLALFGTDVLPAWKIVVGGIAATAVYALALVVTGAASAAELQGAFAAVRRKVRPRRA